MMFYILNYMISVNKREKTNEDIEKNLYMNKLYEELDQSQGNVIYEAGLLHQIFHQMK